jgi:hypothetical protein
MRLCVLYDRAGLILAGLPLDQSSPQQDTYVPMPRPVPQEGQQVAEIDIPEHFRHFSLLDACTKLKVDTRADRPTLVLAEQHRAG